MLNIDYKKLKINLIRIECEKWGLFIKYFTN